MNRRLGNATLGVLPAHAVRPAYDRHAIKPGIVHIGPGAFHRAHQAALIDTLLGKDPRWAITAIALRSRDTTDTLAVQDGLFTLKTLGDGGTTRVIGAITQAFSAPDDHSATLAALANPQNRLITLTVTEKGYCLDGDGQLELSHPDITHDIARPGAPRSAIGWLVAGLAQRKANDAPAPVIISCDNLDDNGTRLASAVASLARQTDPALADWIEHTVRFPRTMVDAITPASDRAFLNTLETELGVRDEAAVSREVFKSWVVEDIDCEPVAVLGRAGAILTSDVRGHALAKLRVLNGAHSALAWQGLALGCDRVSEAMAHDWLGPEIERLVWHEILPGLPPVSGLDPNAYARSVLTRFANPAVSHKLSQIAWDSSQKIPVRLLGTVTGNLADDRPVQRLSRAVAAWMRLVVRAARDGSQLTDPLQEQLLATGRTCSDVPDSDTTRFLTLKQIFGPALAQNPAFRSALSRGYADILKLESGARP